MNPNHRREPQVPIAKVLGLNDFDEIGSVLEIYLCFC